jgi:hypothetical protein
MEVIRKFPWDVWAAIVVAILAVVFDVVFYRAPFTFFLIVALALGGYTAKMLSEREPTKGLQRPINSPSCRRFLRIFDFSLE